MACLESVVSTTTQEIAALQERAARAIPGKVSKRIAGCFLRYSDAPTSWWSGTVLMHGDPEGRSLAGRIAAVEGFYRSYESVTRFQVCPACPPELDAALAERGYCVDRVVTLQAAHADHVAAATVGPGIEVTLDRSPSRAWFDLLMSVHGLPRDTDPEWQIFERVDRPTAYATARLNGRPVAVGRASEDTDWVGIFNMATLPEARGRGAAASILAALARWARPRGNPRMYLQVSVGADSAMRLYERVGFQVLCGYHYRMRP
jgi:GNAT superfamily N-acetyltransferase